MFVFTPSASGLNGKVVEQEQLGQGFAGRQAGEGSERSRARESKRSVADGNESMSAGSDLEGLKFNGLGDGGWEKSGDGEEKEGKRSTLPPATTTLSLGSMLAASTAGAGGGVGERFKPFSLVSSCES